MSGASFREIVAKDRSALARAVAERLAELSAEADRMTIALSGGSTPKVLYETLSGPPFLARVAWSKLELFFGDERPVPPDHPDSNYGLAARTLFAKIPSPAHRMVAERDDAEAYERLVRERVAKRRDGIPVFDVILLGMGDDGHTASLFPATPALEERRRLVVMNDVPQKETRRMTFTYPLINAADRVWVLIAGSDKREMVAKCRAARERGERAYPVLGVTPKAGELVWWLDEAATGAPS